MENIAGEKTVHHPWWHEVECHLSPNWRLPDLDQYMLDTIKDEYQFEFNLEILPDFMTIERLLFAAWIELSSQPSHDQGALSKTVDLVKQANEYRTQNFATGDDASIGYGRVIYAFLMWVYSKSKSTGDLYKEAEDKLKELDEASLRATGFQDFVDVTHAWTLGRLGPEKRCKALRLLDKALTPRKKGPIRERWLFAKALIQGRAAREGQCDDNFQSKPLSHLPQMLEEERKTLKQVTGKSNGPMVDLAKVHFGTVTAALGNGGGNSTKQALRLITQSLPNDCNRAEVALILDRLNKEMNVNGSTILQGVLEHCETKTNITGENRPPDVYLQLAIMYNKQSMFQKALDMVQKAANASYGSKTHLQARLWEAMIRVNLRNYRRAGEIYSELDRENLSDTATKLHFLRSKSNGIVEPVFESAELQYLQNVFEFLLFCVQHHAVKDYLGCVDFESVVGQEARQRMEILRNKAESDDEKIKNRSIQYLAEMNLLLERYKEAEELFRKLMRTQVNSPNEMATEVTCDLAKCLYRQGKFQELREFFDENNDKDGVVNKQGIREIQGLVNLAEGKEKQQEMMSKCEDAIQLGSLDGCLLMLNMHQHFQERFLVFKERYAHRLAKVKLCLQSEKVESSQASNQGNKQKDTKKVLRETVEEKIDAILKYRRSHTGVHESHESVYKKLREIRSSLLDFECILLSENNTCSTREGFKKCGDRQCVYTKQEPNSVSSLKEDCRKAAEDVLMKVRFLFDEVMKCLQIAVLGKPHTRSEFPIIPYDKEKAEKKTKREQLMTRLKNLFQGGYELYIPNLVLDCLVKIQPMFDKENEWLLLLSHTVNQIKHGGLELGTVCRNGEAQLCTSYLVRRSCEEVEKIALFILDKCSEMM